MYIYILVLLFEGVGINRVGIVSLFVDHPI